MFLSMEKKVSVKTNRVEITTAGRIYFCSPRDNGAFSVSYNNLRNGVPYGRGFVFWVDGDKAARVCTYEDLGAVDEAIDKAGK